MSHAGASHTQVSAASQPCSGLMAHAVAPLPSGFGVPCCRDQIQEHDLSTYTAVLCFPDEDSRAEGGGRPRLKVKEGWARGQLPLLPIALAHCCQCQEARRRSRAARLLPHLPGSEGNCHRLALRSRQGQRGCEKVPWPFLGLIMLLVLGVRLGEMTL